MRSRQRILGRHLNDKGVFLGLSFEDVTWLGIIFGATWLFTLILPSTAYRGLSLVVPVVVGIFLIPIRLTFRRRIVRDALVKLLGPKVFK